MPVVPALAEGAGQLEDLDEPPEPRVRGGSGRASLMKPLVVLALPGMYLFYKYSQYRREQRELSRRRVTERELQHLHHKIDKLLTKLEKNEPELASSQEDEVLGASSESSSSSSASLYSDREKRSPQDDSKNCGPPPNGSPCEPPPGSPPGPPPGMSSDDMPQSGRTMMSQSGSSGFVSGDMKRSRRATQVGGDGGGGRGRGGGDMGGGMGGGFGARMSANVGAGGQRGVCDLCECQGHDANCSLRPSGCLQTLLRQNDTNGGVTETFTTEYSMSGKSWVLPQSASEYNMGTGVPVGVTGPGGRWVAGNVPASASLYSMASGSSSISGVSSVSSSSSSSASSTGSSNFGKPTRVRQPSGATLRRSQTQSMKMRIQEYQDPIQQVVEEEEVMRENRDRRLPPIKEFQRDYRAGKASTRIRCAQKIVTQLETSPTPRDSNNVNSSTSSSSTKSTTKRPQSAPKLSVVQEIQKSKKEKEREKEREKAEKARQKEEEKAEKTRQKEAKKLAKEEKKRAKKEAKARRKEAEEALLRE